MRKDEIEQQVTIEAENRAEFDRLANEASREHPGAVREWHEGRGLSMTLVYKETILTPETVADEFELQGIKYYCKDCPNFQKGKNKRCKSQGCKYAEFGTVTDFTPACEWFYKQVLQGKIVPEED